MTTKTSRSRGLLESVTPGDHTPLVFWMSMLIFVFILAPILIVIAVSFTSSEFITFPPDSLSLRWYRTVLTDDSWIGPMRNSVITGVLVAILSTICGTCGTIALNRSDIPLKNALYTFLITPMMVPRIVIAISIFNVFMAANLTGDFLGLTLALTTITIPYSLITTMASFSSLDESTTEASRIHGATRLQTFRHVTFPTILPGMISGAVFSFIIAWNDYIIAVYISGTKGMLPITIFQSLRYRISPSIAAVGTIVIGVSVLLSVLVFIFDERY